METKTLHSSKEYIIEAFFIILKTKSVDKITILEVCAKAGVSRVTFYKYFKTKTDIINEYFKTNEEFFKAQFNELDLNDVNIFRTVTTSTLENLRSNKEKMQALINNHMEQLYLDIITTTFLDSIEDKSNQEYKIMAHIYAGALYSLAIMWIKDDCKDSIDDIIKALCNSLKAAPNFNL